jgi:hypothetical protein
MATTKKFRVKHGLDASNNTISFVNDPVSANDAATKNYVDIQVGLAPGDVSNSYLTSTFTTNTDFQSYIANTNSRIDTLEAGGTLVTNSYLTSTFTTNTDFQSFVANTNAYIATKTDDTTVLATNTALRTLIDDRIQVANATLLIDDRIQVANADAKYATWTALTTSNTAIRSYVDTEVAALVNSAPVTLNTLNELADALGDDPNFATTLTTNLGQKLGATATVTLTGDVTGSGSFSSNAVSIALTDTNLANTNAYIASVSDAQSQYLQVANVASNTSTTSATFASGNSTITFTRDDSSTYDVNLSTFAMANTSTSTAVYTVANATLTFTRADSSTFDVVIDSASVEVSNTAPSGANEGDMWWDNATGELYIYYSNNWVEAVAQDVTPYANNGTFSSSNNTITFVRTDGSQFDVVLTGVGEVTNAYVTSTFTTNTDFQSFVANTNAAIAAAQGEVSNAYLTSTFTTNTDFQSALANTNAYIATKTDDTTVLATNTALRTLINDRMQVANVQSYVATEIAALVNSAPTTLDTLDELASALGDDANFSTTVLTLIGTKASNSALTSTYVTNTVFQSALANTNSYIATKTDDSTVLATNTALRTLISDRIQVANVTGTYVTNTDFQSALANTNSYIATKTDDTTVLATNTALRTLISDRIQVANLNTTLADYWPSANIITYTAKYLEVANSSTGTSVTVSNSAPTITANGELWWDNASGELYVAYSNNWVEAVGQDISPYTNNASYTSGNTTLTFVRTDGSQYEATIDLSGVGEVSNSYLTSNYVTNTDFQSYVANTNPRFAQYLEVANANFATESYVDTSVAALVNSAPTTLNTLDELAQALGDDANFATTITTSLGNKANTSMLSNYLQVANASFVSNVGDLGDVDLTGLSDNSVLKYVSANSTWVVANNSTASATAQAIVPVAFARIATTSNGSGTGLSWSNWNSGSGEMDFTFATAQPDTNYIVVTDAETFDDYHVGISSKTVNGFTASFYDGSGVRSPSSASPFAIIVYGSTPTVELTATTRANTSTTSATLSGNTATFTRADSSTFNLDLSGLSTGGASVTVQNTAPTITSNGDLWWDNSDGELYVAYANNWVEAVAQDVTPYTNNASYTTGNTTLTFVRTDGSQYEVYLDLSGVSGEVSNSYITSTYVTNTDFQSALANTNTYIATKTDDSTVLATNTALRTLISDRIQVANADSKYATWSSLISTNTAIRSYVDTEVAALVNSAPTTLNTLEELATALGDDANFSTTVLTLIGTKASNATLTSTYVTNTVFQSALANTNSYIATKTDDTVALATNTALRTLISDRLQVANAAYVTANTISIKNPANYHEYAVTVDTKTSAHPYSGSGSSSAYFLDSVESPSIVLAPNQTYRFDQSDSTNSSHPLDFYVDADKNTAYTTGVTVSGTAGSAGAYTEIVIDEDTPQVLYYQCQNHSYMGSVASILSDTSPKYLEVANVASNTSTTSASLTGNTATFTRADSSTFTLDLSGIASAGGGASVTVANTAPVSPTEGDLYFDNELATMFIYYDSSWVEVQPTIDPINPLTYGLSTFTANGTATDFTHTSDTVSADAMLVTVDGIIQRPTTDYTVSNKTVTFGTAPSNTSIVAVRVTTGAFTGVSNATFQSALANTNAYIASVAVAPSYLEITSNTTMSAGTKYIVGTRTANVVLTFPTSASLGDEITIIDGTGQANTFGIELNRNGHRIQGGLANVIIDTSRAAGGYVYYNANNGWILTEV